MSKATENEKQVYEVAKCKSSIWRPESQNQDEKEEVQKAESWKYL